MLIRAVLPYRPKPLVGGRGIEQVRMRDGGKELEMEEGMGRGERWGGARGRGREGRRDGGREGPCSESMSPDAR